MKIACREAVEPQKIKAGQESREPKVRIYGAFPIVASPLVAIGELSTFWIV